MFKRVRWVSIGAAVGFGGSVWAQRRVRRAVERYLPEQVAASAGERARNLRSDVRDALEEGRLAMRSREEELRAQVEGLPPARHLEAVPTASALPGGGRPGWSDEVIDVDERRAPQRQAALPLVPGQRQRSRHRRR